MYNSSNTYTMSRISVVLVGLAPRCQGPATLRLWVCIKGFLWRTAKAYGYSSTSVMFTFTQHTASPSP